MTNEEKCVKAVVLIFSMDSESRNSTAQDTLQDEKDNKLLDPYLQLMEPIPDGVHVAKRKCQGFCNWFLWVNGYLCNLVLLRELRLDKFIQPLLQPHLALNSVRNRDRQDVNSLAEIGSEPVREALRKVSKIMHQIIPEKFRVTSDNKQGVLKEPIAICKSTMYSIYKSFYCKQ